MTCPFPFVFFCFFVTSSSAVQLTGSTFLLGSHELHTQHVTNRLVVRFHLFRRFFVWKFLDSFSSFFFAWICCFKCRRATRGGSVKSRRAHQKKRYRKKELGCVVFFLLLIF